jgi:acyl-CoA synthetase (NDP forming)
MQREHFLNIFFEPKSVALIGVSRKTGRGSFNVLENLIRFGYEGNIYPVNPNGGEILNYEVYRKVESLPEGIDLAVLMTRRDVVPEVLGKCAEKGMRGAIIITEGFSEADQEGRLLQARIEDTVRSRGIRVLGPNSIGIMNSFAHFSSSFVPLPQLLAPVALVSQSGGFFEGFPDCAFGKGIDLGNTCDVGFADAISYFEEDDEIRLIVLYVESVKNVSEFIRTCKRVGRLKPIIAIKGGRGEFAGKASASHTGSLSSRDQLYGGMFRQARIFQMDSALAVGDITRGFLSLPPIKGNRVAVVTPTGAGGIMVLDSMENQGFRPAELSKKTIDEIAHLFKPWVHVGNPLDLLSAGMAHGYKHVYSKVLESCLRDERVDIVLAICGAYTVKTIKEVMKRSPQKPVILWVLGADKSLIEKRTDLYGIRSHYDSPDRAFFALKVIREHYMQRAMTS